MFIRLGICEKSGVLAIILVKPTFIVEIKVKQFEDKGLVKHIGKVPNINSLYILCAMF